MEKKAKVGDLSRIRTRGKRNEKKALAEKGSIILIQRSKTPLEPKRQKRT